MPQQGDGEREAYGRELVVGGAAKGMGGGEPLKGQWLWVWAGNPLQVETSGSSCRREPRVPRLYGWWQKSACSELRGVRVVPLAEEARCGEVEENRECQGHPGQRRELSGSACRGMDGGPPALPGFAQQSPLQPVKSPVL